MGELPPTLNEIISVARRNKFASAALKRRWHERIGISAKKMKKVSGEVYLECVWFVKNRRRDPDNICAATKYIFDTLVFHGKIDDDSLKVIQSPVLHHFVISSYDGFLLYFRDRESFMERQREDLTLPPQLPSNLIVSSENLKPTLKKRARPKLKPSARNR
jgi:hypothetical protein